MAELNKGTPQVGLMFRNPDEAWQFWVAYGGRTGFDVRKRYTNLSKFYGKRLHMRWLAVKMAKHLTLASLVMVAKNICRARGRGS
jgi:hypothetical protein